MRPSSKETVTTIQGVPRTAGPLDIRRSQYIVAHSVTRHGVRIGNIYIGKGKAADHSGRAV
jgi:hypothetical protein